MTDIPLQIWGEILAREGMSTELTNDPGFAVAHLIIDRSDLDRHQERQATIL